MAKTATAPVLTATRSVKEWAEEFANISDSGSLRYHQARIAFAVIGHAEGKDAAELKDVFRKEANEALRRHHEAELSVPGVTNLVNTWKYMERANVDTDANTNPAVYDIAKASFNLASQSFREKEKNYVIPAIQAILDGADPAQAFIDATRRLKADKKADQEQKGGRGPKETDADEAITFDTVVAVLGMIPTLAASLTAEQKAQVTDLIASASASLA
jgi:hypothetical protein